MNYDCRRLDGPAMKDGCQARLRFIFVCVLHFEDVYSTILL